MKNLILICLIAFSSLLIQAQEMSKSKNKKVEFQVDGNCEMCKKRIEKAAISVSGVKTAEWNLDSKTIFLLINEEKTNVLTIQKAIANVGHDNDGEKTSQENYDKLHTCCKYDRK